MAIIDTLERTKVGYVAESARQWVYERTQPQEKPQDLIEAATITAIENKADLLLSGPGVRHTGERSGVYRNLPCGASVEITRYLDKDSEEETRYYNIYYKDPEGTNYVYRSVRENDGSSKITINSSIGGLRGVQQSEGNALLHLMRQTEKYQSTQETKRKVVVKFKNAITIF